MQPVGVVLNLISKGKLWNVLQVHWVTIQESVTTPHEAYLGLFLSLYLEKDIVLVTSDRSLFDSQRLKPLPKAYLTVYDGRWEKLKTR